MKKSIWITLAAAIIFSASAHAARAGENAYTGSLVEQRAAMASPEKTAYQEAQRAEHQCVSEHQKDYSAACSRLFQSTVRAQQNFGRFIATGEHASQFRPVAAQAVESNSVESGQSEQEWPVDVIKAIVARNPNWTPTQKAEQLRLYKYSHSCADC